MPVIKKRAKGSEETFAMLLDLLGWRYDKDGSKADSMSDHVASLGVEFDLGQSDKGLVFVSNTKTRRAEILERIESVLQDNMLSKHDTAKLKGRLTFAEGQLFGRASTAFSIRLHNTCFAAFQTSFSSGKPRCVDMRFREIVYLFTNAHYEGGKGGLGGGVLFNRVRTVEC